MTSKYDVNFPMFAKIDVNGENACELYNRLKEAQPGEGESADIGWNFEKFLVDGSDTVVARWGTGVTPEQIRDQLADYM